MLSTNAGAIPRSAAISSVGTSRRSAMATQWTISAGVRGFQFIALALPWSLPSIAWTVASSIGDQLVVRWTRSDSRLAIAVKLGSTTRRMGGRDDRY
jgi:hypothetical protein